MRRRKWLKAVKAAVSLALIAWVFHTALSRDGIGALTERLTSLDPAWIGAAIALQLVAIAVGVLRWNVLLDAQGMRLPLSWLMRSYLVGRFVGAFTPSTAGLDVWRAVDVARRTGRKGDATSVILVEKCVGLLGLAAACVFVMPIGGGRFLGPSALLGAGVLAACAALGLVALSRPRLLATIADKLPGAVGGKARAVIGALGARGLSVGRVALTVALSTLGHGLTAAVFVATALALGVGAAPLEVLVVGLIIVIATLLPISIGGIGVREGVAVALLAAVQVSATDATLVALLGFLSGQVPALAGGVLSMSGTRTSPSAPAIAAPSARLR